MNAKLVEAEEKGYNGWKNWDTWNAYNWTSSDEGVYKECTRYARRDDLEGFKQFVEELLKSGSITDDIDPHEIDWDELFAGFKDEDDDDEEEEDDDDSDDENNEPDTFGEDPRDQ